MIIAELLTQFEHDGVDEMVELYCDWSQRRSRWGHEDFEAKSSERMQARAREAELNYSALSKGNSA
ncbi:MAG: hypothetical protein R2851_08195 [Caldilineaceae bacterium]